MNPKRVALGLYLLTVGGVLLVDASLSSTLLGLALVGVVAFALVCSRGRLERWFRTSRHE
jgi:hypothetical protein